MNKMVKFLGLISLTICNWQYQTLAVNNLDVEFSGELISVACQVASESINKKVTLHNLRWQFINENEISKVTHFTIAIDKCSETDLQKSIKLTWKSNELVDIDGNHFLITKGDSGALLGIIDNNGRSVIWNKPMTIGDVSVVDGSQQFEFGVFVRKPAIGEIKIGEFSSIVTFNVEYE
ncbi:MULTISPECIES: fimbrial protein [unclassified Proteus (in: enterobacteria)]|uniref:fimbrial protein n=1 Tax=unclassified Proteus (in: enterobacteria) TaxID=257482 RepID=UPI00137674DC|nr:MULTISPECIES: fimbrial protein [unclassified Proteus (in: enterobacteria)]NBM99018.1 fimbrial protein [Proteus sp. G4465]NBN06055.1 fimbrial protein [Proteus sp. G4463]